MIRVHRRAFARDILAAAWGHAIACIDEDVPEPMVAGVVRHAVAAHGGARGIVAVCCARDCPQAARWLAEWERRAEVMQVAGL